MYGFVSETRVLASGHFAEIAASLGVPPVRRGVHIHCPSPSHPDRHPSFRTDEGAERWHCTCGHGDVIDLVIIMGRASTLYEAAIYVRGVLALPGANVREETSAQAQARRERLAEMLAKNERRKAEADADYEAESARLLKFARDLYAGGQS